MRQLILMRHAKTEQPAVGQSDQSRQLTERGRHDAPLVAARLARAGARPDIALVSDATRTRQTWELVREAFPDCPHRHTSTLYLAEPEAIIHEALAANQDHVLVIGHNPGIHELACVLADGDSPLEQELHEKLPTSGAAIFERENEKSAWQLREYIRARELRD